MKSHTLKELRNSAIELIKKYKFENLEEYTLRVTVYLDAPLTKNPHTYCWISYCPVSYKSNGIRFEGSGESVEACLFSFERKLADESATLLDKEECIFFSDQLTETLATLYSEIQAMPRLTKKGISNLLYTIRDKHFNNEEEE